MPADHSQHPPSPLLTDVTPDCAGAGAVSKCELAKILAYQEWPFAPVDARRYWAENEWRRWIRQARDIISNYDVRRRG